MINGKLIAGGKYKLVEITAPDGYQVAEAVTFTVNKDGTLTEVTMHDAVEGEIAISKQSVNSTEELEGAKLKITDAAGKTVAEWVSEKTPKLVQLDAGTYTLTEETAPDGYVLAESMTFTVDKNGKVTVKNENGEDVDAGGIIVMKDNTTKVSISKQDITGDKEIPGAKLQVKDETGKNGLPPTSRTKSTKSWLLARLTPSTKKVHRMAILMPKMSNSLWMKRAKLQLLS